MTLINLLAPVKSTQCILFGDSCVEDETLPSAEARSRQRQTLAVSVLFVTIFTPNILSSLHKLNVLRSLFAVSAGQIVCHV